MVSAQALYDEGILAYKSANGKNKRIGLMLEMYAEPVIKVAVEPKTKADQQKMSEALVKLVAEDLSFRFLRDEETGQTIIEGMGELKEGITELFRAGEILRRAKEDKRR